MLGLDDGQWGTLTAHGHAAELPGLLRTLHCATAPAQVTALGHAIAEYVCFEYDIYTAAYAALPYLVAAADGQCAGDRAYLLGLIGRMAALALRPGAPALPPELRADFEAALQRAGELALAGLEQPGPTGDLRLLCGALAAVRGHGVLALDLLETVANPAAVQCPECERFHSTFGYALMNATGEDAA